jgi:hypothetical protein
MQIFTRGRGYVVPTDRPASGMYKPNEVRRIHHFGVTPPTLDPFVPVPPFAANQYDPKIAYLTTLI